MRSTIIVRSTAALLVAMILALAWWERSSPLGKALREGRPCLFWLTLKAGPEPATNALFAAVYQPTRRTLDLVYLPGKSEDDGAFLSKFVPTWKDWSGLPLWRGEGPALCDEPPLDARDWMLRHGLLRCRSSWLRFDRFLLALEINHLHPKDIRTAWLPPESVIDPFFSRLLFPGEEEALSEHPAVEVLNTTQSPGIASRAKNMLRSRGADVMSVGNADDAKHRTLVYDRTGCFANAASVLRMLNCPSAQALTKVDLKRVVDVTVLLAQDCPLPP